MNPQKTHHEKKMPVLLPSLSSVLADFPGHRKTIKHLFRENETFQTICEDYRQCALALKYWNQSGSIDAPARREEYRSLLEDLTEELMRSLAGK
jgi:hypothetical protein